MTISTRIGTGPASLAVLAIAGLLIGGGDQVGSIEGSFDASDSPSLGSITPPSQTAVPSTVPSIEATVTPERTWAPAPAFDPSPDDDLALAGRDGVAGLLYCSNARPFGFDALENPTGAEAMIGPEYDILRSAIGNPPTRELARDDTGVTFLADPRYARQWEAPYFAIDVDRVGATWKWSGAGDCEPRAWAPLGYGAATWTLDPAFRTPGPKTQIVHLLVEEVACSSGRSAHGRIGPAYVTADPFTVRIELVVRHLPGGQDCPAVGPTKARLRLAEPVGDRELKDMNAHLLTGAGS